MSCYCTLILFQEVDIRGRNFDPDGFRDMSMENLLRDLRKPSRRPVRARKINDLKKLMPFVPRVHRPFYESIVPDSNLTNEDSDN